MTADRLQYFIDWHERGTLPDSQLLRAIADALVTLLQEELSE